MHDSMTTDAPTLDRSYGASLGEETITIHNIVQRLEHNFKLPPKDVQSAALFSLSPLSLSLLF